MTQPTKFCTTTSTTKVAKVNKFVGRHHRHLREIDCSLAIVGGPATGAESGGKSIHWTCMWRQKVLHSGCCGWQHNYYRQQRQAGQANEQSTSLRCLWLLPEMHRLEIYGPTSWPSPFYDFYYILISLKDTTS